MVDVAVHDGIDAAEVEYLTRIAQHFGDADEPARASGDLVVRSDAEIESLPPLAWLADQIVPLGGLAALYGTPGSAKSFLGVDLALSLAAGLPWLGRDVVRGGTLYVVGEGLAGLGQRVRAWKAAHGLAGTTLGVGFVTQSVDLMRAGDAARTIAAVRSTGAVQQPPQLIVFDTLARCMIGDENDTKDMSRAIATADLMRHATGAAVLIVHHTKKESDQERGSSALRGAVDTLLLAEEGDDGRQLVCQKQKDAEPFVPIPFRLVAGHGSCIVQASGVDRLNGDAREQAGPVGLTPKRLSALRVLRDDFTARGATTTEWLRSSGLPDRTFYNARTWLVREGYVAESARGGRYTICVSGKTALADATATTAKVLPNRGANVFPGGVNTTGNRHLAGNGSSSLGSTVGSNGETDEEDVLDLLANVDERMGQREEDE